MEIKDVNEFERETNIIKCPLSKIQQSEVTDMVYCAFDELTDLTLLHMANYLDSSKYSSSYVFPLKKRDCTCYYKNDSAVIYSSGGTKYIVPASIKILRIFPLEEGIILQCEYNPDAIHFTLSPPNPEAASYAYLTLNGHPLNDLHPLVTINSLSSFNELICTKIELVYASTELPCVIFFDSKSKELTIGLLRINPEKEEYLASLDPTKTHPLLPRAASKPHLLVDSVFRIATSKVPNSALIYSGFGRNEFTIAIHMEKKEVLFIDVEVGKNDSINFKVTRRCENILSMTRIEDRYCTEMDAMPRLCKAEVEENSLFIGRLEQMKTYLAALDGNGCIYIFRGSQIIFSVDLYSADLQPFCVMHPFNLTTNLFRMNKAEKIEGGRNWCLDVVTNKKTVVKLSFEILQRSPLVRTIFQAIQAVVSKNLFICFYSDYLEIARDIEREGNLELLLLKRVIVELLRAKKGMILESTLKRRRLNSSEGKSGFSLSTAWKEMMQSDYHLENENLFTDLFGKSGVEPMVIDKLTEAMVDISREKNQRNFKLRTDAEEFINSFEQILSVLHLLYEDLKLKRCHNKYVEPMAEFLFQLALNLDVRYSPYVEYYVREYPEITKHNLVAYEDYDRNVLSKQTPELVRNLELKFPSDVFLWVSKKLSSLYTDSSIDVLPIYYEHTRVVCRIFEVLCQGSPGYQISSQLRFLELGSSSLLKLEEASGKSTYPIFSVANSKLKSKRHKRFNSDYYFAKEYKNKKMEKVLNVLLEEGISTEEIENNWPYSIALPLHNIVWYAREHPSNAWDERMYHLIGREDIAFNLRTDLQTGKLSRSHRGYYSNQLSPKRGKAQPENERMRQQRIKEHFAGIEVYKELLGNDLTYNNGEGSHVSNREMKSIAEYRFTADLRYKEVSMLLDSSRTIKLRIHNIKDEDKVSEEKFEAAKQALLYQMIIRQLSKCIGRGALTYGTLLTLPTETLEIPKISLIGKVPPKDTKLVLDIRDETKEKELMNWPEFHNGVAAGLRLARESTIKGGNTRNWIMYQKPRNPKFEHGGFLLAIGLLGYLDCLLSTDIYQYLKAAHEATTISILIGSAASKMSSMDDSLSRTLCLHIPFLLPPSFEIDISMPIQSAAILGAGLLYFGTSHRLMTEMILSQIGRRPLSDRCMDREVYALCAGFALGFVNINYAERAIGLSDLQLDERLIRLIEGGKVMDPPLSMLSANMNAESNKCSSVLEGDNVNIHITAPGAIMSLTIIHMQTDNKTIARRLEIPSTFYALEHAKPFHILLKIVAKNLIMWSQIEGTVDWLYGQLPPLIREIFESPIREVQAKYGGTLIAEEEIDYSAIALCYISILSGSILAMGFKFAGTNNKAVMSIICKEIDKLRNMSTTTLKDQNYVNYTNATKNKIMAGSGDVDCFRTLRILRKHLEKDMNYGHNMAINMCLGFLFLGSGAYTFGQSKTALAALLCSIYPHFPSSPSDNKYHLQAMRHLYVLALQTRLLQVKEVETAESVQVPLTITYSSDTGLPSETVVTPAIVNHIDKVVKISLKDPRFYEAEIHNLAQTNSHWTIYAKKRMCTMMYGDSIKGRQNVLTQQKIVLGDYEIGKEYLNPQNWSFSANNNGLIMLFLEGLCKHTEAVNTEDIESAVLVSRKNNSESYSIEELKQSYEVIERICETLNKKIEKDLFAVECFSEGKAEVLPIYIWLLDNIHKLDRSDSSFFKELKVLLGFSNVVGNLFNTVTKHDLLSGTFLSDVKGSVDSLFSVFRSDPSYLKGYLHSNGILAANTQSFNGFLSFNQILSALYLQKTLINVRVEAQKQLQRFKDAKQLSGYIIDLVKKRINGVQEGVVNEDVKQMLYYLWSILRNTLPGIDSSVADQLLLIVFEQF